MKTFFTSDTHYGHGPARENIINVGVDVWDFIPRTWEELRDG